MFRGICVVSLVCFFSLTCCKVRAAADKHVVGLVQQIAFVPEPDLGSTGKERRRGA